MLDYLLAEDADFPVRSKTILWQWMRKLGFVYKRTSKVIVPLDSPSFMAARARYFKILDQLRSNGNKIFWHDETWCNKNEEKTFIWTDGTGKGRLRQTDGKGKFNALKIYFNFFVIGKRIVISALMSDTGFHLPTLDIFECDENHSMDSDHFIAWIDRTAAILQKEHGRRSHIFRFVIQICSL